MTDNEYLEQHIPHRVNLLLTFRERYGETAQSPIAPEQYRDLYRCSKDISMLMVRFFLHELGVYLPRKKANRPDDLTPVPGWKSRCGMKQLSVEEVRKDTRSDAIFEVLKAANRAVAHLEDADVDHPIKADDDLRMLVAAIDFTEQKVMEKIYYEGQQAVFHTVMAHPDNDMKRSKG